MFYLLYVVGFKWNKNLVVEIFCGNFFLVVIDKRKLIMFVENC